MTKKEIIASVAKKTELKIDDVTKVFDEILNLIKEEVDLDKEVTIPNFGKFVVNKVKGRMMRNLQTGEPMKTEESHRISFKAYPSLKEYIKNKYR